MTFESLRIDPRVLNHLRERGITNPTPIQSLAIPVAATGDDLVAIAQTGTGKTLAFGLPALSALVGLPRGRTGMLVLTPTRELAQQVHDVLEPIARILGLTSTCVYGGVGMERQAAALRRGASVVVACPGRLLDHLGRGNANLSNVEVLVMDEADRMLDMGFLPDIRRIEAKLSRERQTLMFSATFPTEIARLAETMMFKPKRVEAGPVAKPADAVQQGVFTVAREQKTELLKRILREKADGPTLVFLRTKRATDRLQKVLSREGFSVEAIHGDQSQGRRQQAIDGFRSGRYRILVATDVAARGLDVKGISHVVNYDMPATSDDYIHRIGRTARANATGEAITFVTVEDLAMLRDIERTIGRKIEHTPWEGALPIVEAPKAGPGASTRRALQPRGRRSAAVRGWR